MDVCVGTCSQHQWSVSASEAPKRRGATLGARHNAASTHPLWLFLSPSIYVYISISRSFSLSLSLSSSLCIPLPFLSVSLRVSAFPFACLIPGSHFFFFATIRSSLCLFIRRARNLRKSLRRHPPPFFFPYSSPIFRREEIAENFSANVTPFSQNFYFSFCLASFATTRHVPSVFHNC